MNASQVERVLEVLQKLTSTNVSELLSSCLDDEANGLRLVSTLNLQHLRQIAYSEHFFEIYKKSHIIVADGVPVVWLARVFLGRRIARLAGVDICKGILTHTTKSAVIGSNRDTLAEAQTITQSLSHVEILDPMIRRGEEGSHSEAVISLLGRHEPQFVILALGSPKQEYFFESLSRLNIPNGITFFGLGGSLDILSGRKSRAPIFLQKSGLEWVWRLCQSPQQLFPRYARDGNFLIKLILSLLTKVK
jgi:exopolysaccharide biosynthesis WecB/TagA/CpsF family protein